MNDVLMARMANRTAAMLQVRIFFVLDALGIAESCRAATRVSPSGHPLCPLTTVREIFLIRLKPFNGQHLIKNVAVGKPAAKHGGGFLTHGLRVGETLRMGLQDTHGRQTPPRLHIRNGARDTSISFGAIIVSCNKKLRA